MPVDMTKKPEPIVEEVKELEQPKEQIFNIGLTKDEIETIKSVLRESKNVETYVATVKGSKEYKILEALDSL